MLIPSKFSGYQSGIRVYPGKGSAPPPPDYQAAAKETAAGNKEAAQFAVNANRINQVTPYGSLTYSKAPRAFDQAGYDAAMAKFNAGTPDTTAPTREQFMAEDDGGGWTQTMNLTPQAQATLDKQLALSDQYADVAGIGFDRTRQIFENPQIDESTLPQRGIDIGKTAQEALLSRIEPNLEREDEALRTRLANQGIGLGSTAYGREIGLQGQRGTDLRLQAALQGINLDQANRAAALNEAYTAQSRPLDLINALRTGAQVQNPQFQQFAQQQTTSGPNMLAAADAGYQAQVDAVNAKNAQTSGLIGGIAGIGLGLAGLPGAGGSMVQGARGLFA